MTADYNGWNDLPEAEREALDEADEKETKRAHKVPYPHSHFHRRRWIGRERYSLRARANRERGAG